ncbi:hypothetical protein QOZ98_002281 [Planomicrobium stackebrandtii]|uniref:Uncharacterized protein n=1 Tax=Planomicrobium stackebrandtii TaxID=253160 RepID=A0ABU0GVR1_9BACL|nr:hypothetical protein [Planomicrobium stackebrandtii]
MLVLALSSGIGCIVLNIYLFNNPGTENAQFLTRLSYGLLMIPIPIALGLDKLRNSKRKSDKRNTYRSD